MHEKSNGMHEKKVNLTSQELPAFLQLAREHPDWTVRELFEQWRIIRMMIT